MGDGTDRRRWVWVSMPHATFGIAVAGGRIVEGPPMVWADIRRRVGVNDERAVAAYWRARGAVFRVLDRQEEPAND